jgi:hypothetical protein
MIINFIYSFFFAIITKIPTAIVSNGVVKKSMFMLIIGSVTKTLSQILFIHPASP